MYLETKADNAENFHGVEGFVLSSVTWSKTDHLKWLILSNISIVKCFFLQVN